MLNYYNNSSNISTNNIFLLFNDKIFIDSNAQIIMKGIIIPVAIIYLTIICLIMIKCMMKNIIKRNIMKSNYYNIV